MLQQKIVFAQIDPNGVCNSKCWFCPVAYVPNPEQGKKAMPIDVFESILEQLVENRGKFVSEEFYYVYTAHYNEVLMYPYFREMLEALRKHRLCTMILSNGTPLTKSRIALIREYPDVVRDICLNMPAIEQDVWTRFTGMSPRALEATLDNIRHLHSVLPDFVRSGRFSIQVNGINERSLFENGGHVDLGPNAPYMDLTMERGTLERQYELFRMEFPETRIFKIHNLIDRAGYLEKLGVMTNIRRIRTRSKGTKSRVVGCTNMRGGRPYGWLHVNANADVFLCCNDYHFDYLYGNLRESNLEEIWNGSQRQEAIKRALGEICTSCMDAVWAES